MNANAAILDNDELAAIEREEAEKLAPEIVRDLNQMAAEQEAIADKLPAELASISEMFSAMVERKAEIARKAAEDIAEVDAQMLRTLNQVLRRVAVTEDLLRQERETRAELQRYVAVFTNAARSSLAGLESGSDIVAGQVHQTATHERLYREQYEHVPEPPDDDGGSRAPVTARDRELVDAVDFETAQLREYFARPKEALPAPQPSLRSRVMNAGRAMLNPSEIIRRNASPPYAA